MTMHLSAVETKILRDLSWGKDGLGSDRAEDKAKTRMKRLGLIRFDRSRWRWELLNAGHAALNPPKDPPMPDQETAR